MLVPAVQWSESVTRVHIPCLLKIPFPSRSPQSIEYSSLCCTVGPYPLSILYTVVYIWASQVSQWVKNLPAMQEMQKTAVWSLGWEDPLEEGMATHSSILAWRTPWTEEAGGLQFLRSQSHTQQEQLSTHTRTHCVYVSPRLPVHPACPSPPWYP